MSGFWYPQRFNGLSGLFGFSNWNPSQIATRLWLDGNEQSTIILNGSTVSQWKDRSGNNRHFVQAVAVNQPTYTTVGGKNVLSFDGAGDTMQLGSSNLLRNVAGASVFFVGQWASVPTTTTPILLIQTFAGASRLLFGGGLSPQKYTTHGRRVDADALSAAGVSTQNITANSFVIHETVLDYSSAVTNQYINGVLDGQNTTFQTAGLTSDTASSGCLIGSGGTNTFPGLMAELLVVEQAVTLSLRQKIEGYLAWKWNIVANLPVDHPYKNTPPLS